MRDENHERAQRLISASRVEGISPRDQAWLDAHVEACGRCAALARSTERALGSLRSLSVPIDASLVNRTRLKVYLRAQELHEEQHRTWALWISCALSWILGVASAPFVWRAFAWLGEQAGLPSLVWQIGFVMWWALPAGVAAAVVAWHKSRAVDEEASSATLPRSNS